MRRLGGGSARGRRYRAAVTLAVMLGGLVATAPGAAAAGGATTPVSFHGVSVAVPASWPVRDFRTGGAGCVRLDRAGLYLGAPTVSTCPAHLVGAATTVRIVDQTQPGTGVVLRNANGVDYLDASSVGGPLTVAPGPGHAGVVITVGSDPGLARRIADSIRLSGTVVAPTVAAPAGRPASPTGAAPRATSGVTGGFDTCTAPSTSTMKAWLSSPYRSVGIYTGGADRACSQDNLNASWVHTVVGEGWSLIPTYVGLQAPCTGFSGRITPANAPAQGAASADDAVNGLISLGLGSGSPIYFDMENYNTGDSACVTAVESFLNAWTGELHNRGYLSGVYSSDSSGMTNLEQETTNPGFQLPDAIWFAHWNGSNTVYGDSYIRDGDWNNHQRIHQYSGGQDQTYGGVTLTIDQDAVDGPTAPHGPGNFPTVDVFHPLPVARIYGTGAPPLQTGTDRVISVLGQGGIPSANVDAVVINVEVYRPTLAGYLRVIPTGSQSPTAVQEFGAQQTISNQVTPKLGPGGTLSLHLSAGSAQIYVDVSGYFAPASAGAGDLFHPLTTARIYGTNSPSLVSGADQDVPVLGVGGVPTTNVDAVVVAVEVYAPTSAGYLRVVSQSGSGTTATQEFAAGQAISNLVTVLVGPAGTITLHLSAGSAQVFVDVAGYFTTPAVTTGDSYHPLPTARIYGPGAPPLVRRADRNVAVRGVGGIPTTGVDAVVLNAETYLPSNPGYLRITPTGTQSPSATQEFGAGQTIADLVVVSVSSGGTVNAHLSAGSADLYLDSTGYYG